MSQLIYKNGCWTCKKARADPQLEYVCPQERQHWINYQKELEQKPWTNSNLLIKDY